MASVEPQQTGNFVSGSTVEPLPFVHLAGDGVAQVLGSPGDGVLIDVGGDRFLRGALDFGGRGKIREALRQIDGVILHRLPRHLADHGLGKMLNLVAEKVLGCGVGRHRERIAVLGSLLTTKDTKSHQGSTGGGPGVTC